MGDAVGLPRSIAGAPPAQWLAAPSPVYLTGEEFLRVSSLANLAGVTLTITGRILRPDNTISRLSFTHAPNSNRTIATTIVQLSEGWLLALTVRASAGAPAFGQVWTLLELGISSGATFTVDQTLGSGFMTTNTPFAWPVSVNMLPLDGPGNLRIITGSAPAAGADILETVPTGARWELLAFTTSLTTSGVAGGRQPTLQVDDGTTSYVAVGNPQNNAATTTQRYWWMAGGRYSESSLASLGNNGFPASLKLLAGHRLKTVTVNLDVADQWTAPKYVVLERMTGE